MDREKRNRLSKIQAEKNFKNPKANELFIKYLQEDTKNNIGTNNENNNYYISPKSKKINFIEKTSFWTLNEEELDIAEKLADFNEYNNNSQDFIQDENNNDNVNEKLLQVKDEYIDYLQKQLDENNKNIINLESKLNELQKKFQNLLDENKILRKKLNANSGNLIQENENLKKQISKYKKEIQYYVEKIELYETNINDYNDIIIDLKISNKNIIDNLTKNLDNKNKDSNNDQNKNYNTNNYNNFNYFNVKNINNNDEIFQFIKNQNIVFLNDIKSKDSIIDLITKKNNKLISENNMYKTQLEQYSKQISHLYNIIKQKNKIIVDYRKKEGGFTDDSTEEEFRLKKEDLNLKYNNILLSDISKDDILNNT